MPFSGVRISWLMLATNALLARLAVSASSRERASASLARVSSASARLSALMSKAIM